MEEIKIFFKWKEKKVKIKLIRNEEWIKLGRIDKKSIKIPNRKKSWVKWKKKVMYKRYETKERNRKKWK